MPFFPDSVDEKGIRDEPACDNHASQWPPSDPHEKSRQLKDIQRKRSERFDNSRYRRKAGAPLVYIETITIITELAFIYVEMYIMREEQDRPQVFASSWAKKRKQLHRLLLSLLKEAPIVAAVDYYILRETLFIWLPASYSGFDPCDV